MYILRFYYIVSRSSKYGTRIVPTYFTLAYLFNVEVQSGLIKTINKIQQHLLV